MSEERKVAKNEQDTLTVRQQALRDAEEKTQDQNASRVVKADRGEPGDVVVPGFGQFVGEADGEPVSPADVEVRKTQASQTDAEVQGK